MAHTYPHETVVEIAMRCFREDVVVAHALDRSDTASSTWSRWRRQGTKPQEGTLAKINTAIDQLIKERDDAERAAGAAAQPDEGT